MTTQNGKIIVRLFWLQYGHFRPINASFNRFHMFESNDMVLFWMRRAHTA